MEVKRYCGEIAKKLDKNFKEIGWIVVYEYYNEISGHYNTDDKRTHWMPKWKRRNVVFATKKEAEEYNSSLGWERFKITDDNAKII